MALYIDGVYIYSPVGNVFPVGGDIERIEVLKGPQGTLFGRDGTAGVIQIVTKDPSHDAGGEFTIGYGNYGTITSEFYGTVGLSDTLAADFSVYEKHMSHGYGVDLLNGSPTSKADQTLYRTKWLWTPSDTTEVRTVLSHTQVDGSNYDIQIVPGHLRIDGQVSNTPPYDTNTNSPNAFRGQTYLASLQVDQEVGFGKLENIVSYRDVPTALYQSDNEASPLPIINASVEEPSGVLTEELRLLSPKGSTIDCTGGLYYIHADTNLTPLDLSGLVISPAPAHLYEYDTQALSALSEYVQASVEVFRDTLFTAGARYNDERLATPGTRVESPLGTVLVPGDPEKSSYHNVSWRFALDHKWTTNFMTYVSATRSFKSGGFNLASAPGETLPPFLPEQLTALEIGEKSELFDQRLRLNVAAYYYKFKNSRVQVDLPAGIFASNGPSATYKGVVADFTSLVAERFTVSGAFNYVLEHYGDFPGAIGYSSNPFNGSFVFDRSGKNTVYTPLWSGNLAANYVIPSSVGEFALNANMNFRDKVYVAVANRLTNPAYLVEIDSLSWTRGRLNVRLWVQNAFDRQYLNFINESGIGDSQTWAPPRPYGASLTVKFGAM